VRIATTLTLVAALAAATRNGSPQVPVAQGDTAAITDSTNVELDTVRLVPETTITVAEAIAGAVRTSPVAAQASAGVRVSESSQRVSMGEYLPSLSATTAWYHAGTPGLGGSTVGTSLGGLGGFTGGTSLGGSPGSTGSTGAVGSPSTTTSADMIAGTRQATSGTTGTGGNTNLIAIAAGPYNNAYGTIAAGWDVFTAGRRPADVTWARDRTRAARSTEVEQHYALIGVVKSTFYNVMRDEDLEEVARSQLHRAEEDLRFGQHRRSVGTATPADVLQFELNLNTARQTLLQTISNRRSDAYALGRLAGVNGAADARREGSIEPVRLLLSDSEIVALAGTEAPMLVASRDSARAADAATYAARTQYVPIVRVGASYTVAQYTSVLSTLRPGWAFDVGTVFPIFNGFVREDEVERADAARSVAHVSARDAERNARAQAEALLGTVHLAAQQIRLARVSVASARENYRVEESRYAVGVATVLDLAIAAQNVAAAEQSLVNARYDYQIALANLDTLVGREL